MQPVVYLLDVDNTLLDNDAVADDLRAYLTAEFGAERQERYWVEFERLRSELGYADYLGALQRFRAAYPHDTHLLAASEWLVEYPFADRLYPHALDVLAELRRRGKTAILSDGDVVFQPRKIRRSGIWDAVDGNVLVYVHKERELDDVERRYPAERYVLVDDKLRILAAIKEAWGERVTTVFPRQGHYALDPAEVERYPAADVTVERIGDLLDAEF
ncbi:MAG TPA: HAD family hydrolase [Gaiellaceae bacterium]|nr:HAD family hydrolase [Gaiellaceae bacterium]